MHRPGKSVEEIFIFVLRQLDLCALDEVIHEAFPLGVVLVREAVYHEPPFAVGVVL
jgi:hypothetical protein